MHFAFPLYPLKTRSLDGQEQVWDIIRKKWLVLAGEEFVRQQLIHHLVQARGVASGRIGVEREIAYHKLRKRFDLVVFDRNASPLLLCECKAPEVPISRETLLQIARYNHSIGAPYLLITNGQNLYLFAREKDTTYRHLTGEWPELNG